MLCLVYSNVFIVIIIGFLIHFLPEKWKFWYREKFSKSSILVQLIVCVSAIFIMYQIASTSLQLLYIFNFLIMPAIKNALLRYRIIDRSIRNEYSPYQVKKDLRQLCEEEIFGSSDGSHICDSTIEKDLFAMRIEHDAPISYSKKKRGYYYSESDFSMDDVPLTEKDINAIKAASTILHQFKNTSLFGQYEFAIQKILDRAIISEKQNFHNEDQIIQFETLPTIRGNENLELFLSAIKKKK